MRLRHIYPYFVGLLYALGVAAALFAQDVWTSFRIQFFHVWFIPVGSIALGIAGCFGFVRAVVKNRVVFRWWHKLATVVYSGLVPLVAYSAQYLALHVDEKGFPEYGFRGEHISRFVDAKTGAPVTWSSFIVGNALSAPSVVDLHIGFARPSIDLGPLGGEVLGYLGLVGFVVGGLVFGAADPRKHLDTCPSCGKYLAERFLFEFDDSMPELDAEELTEIAVSAHSIMRYGRTHGLPEGKTRDSTSALVASFCEDCWQGRLTWKRLGSSLSRSAELRPAALKELIEARNARGGRA